MEVRLQKFLAEAGLGSRRACESLIRAGRVTIDGKVATIGMSLCPERQEVAVDGRKVKPEKKEYWLLNKPAGVLSAVVDQRGRRTVVELVPSRARLFPVGRLDLRSTGLLLLTNDGELAARLLHPRYHVAKEYVVTVAGMIQENTLARLRGGVELAEGRATPDEVKVLSRKPGKGRSARTILSLTIHEGRKHQVRRMLEAVGHRVLALHRSRFAGLTDQGLALGRCRELSPAEVRELYRLSFGEPGEDEKLEQS